MFGPNLMDPISREPCALVVRTLRRHASEVRPSNKPRSRFRCRGTERALCAVHQLDLRYGTKLAKAVKLIHVWMLLPEAWLFHYGDATCFRDKLDSPAAALSQ